MSFALSQRTHCQQIKILPTISINDPTDLLTKNDKKDCDKAVPVSLELAFADLEDLEKQVIAQMSIDRLTRKIQIREQALRRKKNWLNKRLFDVTRKLERLQSRCLKGKFVTDRERNVLGWAAQHSSCKQNGNYNSRAVISIGEIIKSERYAKKLLSEMSEISTMENDDTMAMEDLKNQLKRCKKYAQEHTVFF